MSEFVKVTVDDTKLRLSFSRLVEGMKPAKVLKIAGEVMRGSIERTFKEEGSPAGSWPPRAESTKRRYKGKSAGHNRLIMSGRLKNSISYKVEGSRLSIGTNLKYAAVHQFGSKGSSLLMGLADRLMKVAGHVRRVLTRDLFGTVSGRRKKIASGVGFVGEHSRRRGAQNIPARPYLVFRPEDPQRIETAVDVYLGNLAKDEPKGGAA